MNFFRAPSFLHWIYPQATWRIKTSEKELYLTFDDGPVPGPTEFVLETLAKYNSQATFFCIGDNIHKHPHVFKKIVQGGHSIGNHTFNHLKGWKTSSEKYLNNIHLCDQEISKKLKSESFHETISESNRMTRLFRPPYGRIKRRQIRLIPEYKLIMWDVLTHDYSQSLSPESCLKGSIGATRPGSIIVFHDSVKAERNMKYALPRLMEHFGNEGYVFKSL